ncbi:MAG: adenylate/guanylate cyclase domain-containing protein [Gammaproteobacteria bacterium]|nr:adenylate/guanylate cyclase domain-containing protein [Gammaproteobacteria bacterium]
MKKNIRSVISTCIILLFIAQPIGQFNLPLFDRIENFTYDTRLKYTAPYTVDTNIVILDIDEKSLAKLGQWPWDRNVIAAMVDNLFDHYKINALGFDIIFAEPDADKSLQVFKQLASGPLKQNQQFQQQYNKILPTLNHDKTFSDSLKNRKTILGFAFIDENNSSSTILPAPALDVPALLQNKLSLIEQEAYVANLPILQNSAYSGGFIDNPSIAYDNDGVFRRVPLLQQHQGEIYQSLAFGLFRAAIGSPAIELQVEASDHEEVFISAVKVGDYEIPVDQETNILVPYRGYWQSFPYISALDVLQKTAPVTSLKDAIVIIGTSAAGLKDLRTTPLETGYPGVEVHANIISGMIENRIKKQASYTFALEFLLLLAIGIVLSLIFPRLSPLYTSLTAFSAIMLLILGNLYAWESLNLVLPLTNSLLLVIALFGFHMSYGFFAESHNKRQITRLFGQYVPPELVDELSHYPEELSLDGETREMSVLFSDVRSFTTISENLNPKELTRFINGFLTPMTQIIHHNRGTIDKYMGDAIMAFWGAPLTDEEHARHTLIAGMEMIEEMKTLSAAFREKNWPEIKIGVGINSGPMNVGNMGSEFRMAYTVLGDTVNLGSRLEGLTKTYGVDIIVSEYTKELVPEFEYRFLDKVRVKGKDQPVTIYEPLGLKTDISASTYSELEQHQQAISHFLSQQWQQASELFTALSEQHPKRKIYTIYLKRIQVYISTPPDQNWDGAFTHTSK